MLSISNSQVGTMLGTLQSLKRGSGRQLWLAICDHCGCVHRTTIVARSHYTDIAMHHHRAPSARNQKRSVQCPGSRTRPRVDTNFKGGRTLIGRSHLPPLDRP